MSQLGFNSKSTCGGTTSTTPEGVEYVDPTCDPVTEVEDKLRVVGKKAVMHITVDVWDTIGCDGDNIVRMYNEGDCVYTDGLYYWSTEDNNVDTPPSSKWTDGYTKCEMLHPYRYVDCAGVDIEDGECLVKCSQVQELAYYFGNDNGNEEVADQYTYDLQKLDNVIGPITPIPGGVRIDQDGIYDILFVASAGSNGLGTGLTIITPHINGNSVGADTNIAGISWSLGDNPTGNTHDGDDYHPRGGLTELVAGDEVVLRTVEGFGFAGNKKASASMWVKQLAKHQVVDCPN